MKTDAINSYRDKTVFTLLTVINMLVSISSILQTNAETTSARNSKDCPDKCTLLKLCYKKR